MDSVKLHYEVSGDDFTRAGEASGDVKRVLKELGFDPDVVRNVSIAMYEGEINMVIHAGGGEIDVEISPDCIQMVLADHGKGEGYADWLSGKTGKPTIRSMVRKDVELAMKAGYSTAPDQVRSLGFGAGMGLPNIKKYTDEMVIETEIDVGTTMRLKVYTQNQPSA